MKDNIAQLIKHRLNDYRSKKIIHYKDEKTQSYKSYSAGEFILKTELISKSLLQNGFGYGDKIGIFSDNIPEWTMTDLAILAIRGIVVPFFATANRQDLKYIINETQMQLIFIGNAEQYAKIQSLLIDCQCLKKIVVFDEAIPYDKTNTLTLHEFCNQLIGNDTDDKLKEISTHYRSDDIATIIYTSGTTGDPKGVILDHHNFYHCFINHDIRLQMTSDDISLCFLPLSHIFERTWTLYLLYKGASNIFLKNPKQVIETMQETKPTLMCTVPRFFEKTYEGIMAEYVKWAPVKQKIFSWAVNVGKKKIEYTCNQKRIPVSLRLLGFIANILVCKKIKQIFGGRINFMPCAGAAMRTDLLKFFHAAGIFVNYGYGTTETTATVSCFKPDIYSYESCGSIMPNTQVKITENNEICVKAETVFKGYYKKPEETQKVLIDGWYHTGDSGYLFSEDYLMMTDRIRDIFKTSGGKYVSPQKIELILGEEPLIEQIMAIGDNRKFISALIVPSKPQLLKLASEMKIDISDYSGLMKNEIIIDYFRQKITMALLNLNPYERIIRFTLLAEPFTIENKGLTSTLKMRRKIIEQQYKDCIEKMYSEE